VRAIRERDLPTLQTAPRVGKKIAERLCVELGDKMREFAGGEAAAAPALDGGAADAVRALVSLGYSQADAERAIRKAMDGTPAGGTADLVRAGLAALQKR
jgi:Holliday junction DNA helicase RuvA